MKKTKRIEDDVRSITSSASSRAKTHVDEKLLSMVSDRVYDKIDEISRKKAIETYRANFRQILRNLNENHRIVEEIYGTEKDAKDHSWRIHPSKFDEESLTKEIEKLKNKIKRIKKENEKLQAENDENKTKLQLIYEQNENLNRLKVQLDL